LSCKIQNAIKLENISNLITSPSSREGPGFGTGNNQFNQNPNFGPPNSKSMYNERNSKGFDRTYQALSREGPGFGTGNNQFNQNPNVGPSNSI
jgi:hypothetical protein